MTSGMPPVDFSSIINALERRDLDNQPAPDSPPIWGQIENFPFLRVRGQSAFWKSGSEGLYEQRMDDLLSSVYGLNAEFQYLILSISREVAVFMGLGGADSEPQMRSLLSSNFPGILLDEYVETHLGSKLRDTGFFSHRARFYGIPTRKSGQKPGKVGEDHQTRKSSRRSNETPVDKGQQMERILRGLAGEAWGLWIRAVPVSMQSVTDESYDCLKHIASIASQSKWQVQKVSQTMQQIDPRTQAGSTESTSGEIINREAEYAVDLLEAHLNRLDIAKSVGMWKVEVHLFSPSPDVLTRSTSLVRAVFSGLDSCPQPVRVALCSPSATLSASKFCTQLTSLELATLSQLSCEEVPGFRITDYARFDTDMEGAPGVSAGSAVDIGKILNGNRKLDKPFSLPLADFSKHGLIVGMTGSGKTTTMFGILDQLWNIHKVPFVVIEPAKAEYRHLRGRTKGPISDLRIYTLGDETVSPLRLNPFEFEIQDIQHKIHVQTHIDYLKAVFNAAFILYAPMPYVLETCLHEIYTDCGWDLTTGLNNRLLPEQWKEIKKLPVFPTLDDLYNKIDEVTDRLGYEERIEKDVKAGLKARVGSLRLGSKGLMLNTPFSLPVSELLSFPTVLELERIGNDDEKSFLIGLIVTRIYEYRRVQASMMGVHVKFSHLLIVEEAHRLLKNVNTNVETESSNTKGHAVETFSNMLAEVRAYGQGVFIAEQIPTKLTPDAIKNTNLKLIHRLVSADDRQVLAGATNMDEQQERVVSTLPPGRAVAFGEQADHPFLIEMENFKHLRLAESLNDQIVHEIMRPFLRRSFYDSIPDYSLYLGEEEGGGGASKAQCVDWADRVQASEEFVCYWSKLMLYLIRDPSSCVPLVEQLTTFVSIACGRTDLDTLYKISKLVLLRQVNKSLHKRGRYFNWTFPHIEEMRHQLTGGLVKVLEKGIKGGVPDELNCFVNLYRERSRITHGPMAGCVVCKSKCWIRHDVVVPASERTFQHEIIDAIKQPRKILEIENDLRDITTDAILRFYDLLPVEDTRAIAVCLLAQATAFIGLGFRRQRKITEKVSTIISKESISKLCR